MNRPAGGNAHSMMHSGGAQSPASYVMVPNHHSPRHVTPPHMTRSSPGHMEGMLPGAPLQAAPVNGARCETPTASHARGGASHESHVHSPSHGFHQNYAGGVSNCMNPLSAYTHGSALNDTVGDERETVHLYGPRTIIHLHTPHAHAHIFGAGVAVHVHKEHSQGAQQSHIQGALSHTAAIPMYNPTQTEYGASSNERGQPPDISRRIGREMASNAHAPVGHARESWSGSRLMCVLDTEGVARWVTESERLSMQRQQAERHRSQTSSAHDTQVPTAPEEVPVTGQVSPSLSLTDLGITEKTSEDLARQYKRIENVTKIQPSHVTINEIHEKGQVTREKEQVMFVVKEQVTRDEKVQVTWEEKEQVTCGEKEQVTCEEEEEEEEEEQVTWEDNDMYESGERDTPPRCTDTLQLATSPTVPNTCETVLNDRNVMSSRLNNTKSHDLWQTATINSQKSACGEISDYALTEHDEDVSVSGQGGLERGHGALTGSQKTEASEESSRVSATLSERGRHAESTREYDLASQLQPFQGDTDTSKPQSNAESEEEVSSGSEESGNDDTVESRGNSQFPESDPADHVIFVVHADDMDAEDIESKIVKGNSDMTVEYMQDGLSVPGRKKHDYMMMHLRTSTKVLLVLTAGFSSCSWCRFALQSLVPHMKEKVIPVRAAPCPTPDILSVVNVLSSSDKYFSALLTVALKEPPAAAKTVSPVKGHDPYLVLTERCRNPVKPHSKVRINVPSSPDEKNDSKVVFRIKHVDASSEPNQQPEQGVPHMSVQVDRVYSMNQAGESKPILKSDHMKHIAFWLRRVESKSKEDQLNDITWWLRFKNPPNGLSIIAYLTFKLLWITKDEKGLPDERLVHSLQLEFATRADRAARPDPVMRRVSGAAAEDEDEDEDRPKDKSGKKRKDTFDRRLTDYIVELNADGSPKSGLPSAPTDGVLGYKRKAVKDGYSQQQYEEYVKGGAIGEIMDEDDEHVASPDPTKEKSKAAEENLTKRLEDFLSKASAEESAMDEFVLTEQERRDMAEEAELLESLNLRDKKELCPKPGFFRKKKYHDMCHELEELGDIVKDEDSAQKFHETAQAMYDSVKHKQRTDEQIVIRLKQAGMEHYRNNVAAATELAMQAMDLVNKAQYRHQMKARIFYYISAIHRENNALGKAKFWVNQAKKLLTGVEQGEDTAKAHYHEGRLCMKMLGSRGRGDETVMRECSRLAIRAFNTCCNDARYDYVHYGMRLELSLVRRCYLHMARVCVDMPELPCARERDIVTVEDLLMAKLCLTAVKMPEYWSTATMQDKMQLQLVESGYCYRRAELFSRWHEAKYRHKARKSLNNAIEHAERLTNFTEYHKQRQKQQQLVSAFITYMRTCQF